MTAADCAEILQDPKIEGGGGGGGGGRGGDVQRFWQDVRSAELKEHLKKLRHVQHDLNVGHLQGRVGHLQMNEEPNVDVVDWLQSLRPGAERCQLCFSLFNFWLHGQLLTLPLFRVFVGLELAHILVDVSTIPHPGCTCDGPGYTSSNE